MGKRIEINLKDLNFWGKNPRFNILDKDIEITDKGECIRELFKDTKKMKELASDIANYGPNPNELLIVLKVNEKYYVYEGNRRLACMDSIVNNDYLNYDNSLFRHVSSLKKEKIPEKLLCYEVDNVEEAYRLVEKLHGKSTGASRLSWGSLNKDAFKVLKNPNNKVTISPSYTLVSKYNEDFKNIIGDSYMKPTDVDRILTKTNIKTFLNIKSYDNLSKDNIIKIKNILKKADKIAKEEGNPISRSFPRAIQIQEKILNNTDDLMPVPDEQDNKENNKDNTVRKLDCEQLYVKVKKGESYDLNLIVKNKKDFEGINYLSYGSIEAKINEKNIFVSDNNVGKYQIKITGYVDGVENDSKIIDIEVHEKTYKAKANSSNNELFSSSIKCIIDINPGINNFLNQWLSLDIDKHLYVMSASIRSLLEETVKDFCTKFNVELEKFENNLCNVCKHILENDFNKLCKDNNISFQENKNLLELIGQKEESKKIVNKLNVMTHSSSQYITKNDLIDIVNTKITPLFILITMFNKMKKTLAK